MAKTFTWADNDAGPVNGLMDAPAQLDPASLSQFANRVYDKVLAWGQQNQFNWSTPEAAPKIVINQTAHTVSVLDGDSQPIAVYLAALEDGKYEWSLDSGSDADLKVMVPEKPSANIGSLAARALKASPDELTMTLEFSDGTLIADDGTAQTILTPDFYEAPDFTDFVPEVPDFWE